MAAIVTINGKTPKLGENNFVAETAAIIGDVTTGRDCSIWYGAVLRGDVNPIILGHRVNIQDGSVLHTLYKRSTVVIEDDVSIGHNVTLHGATIRRGALIGMGSTLLDDVEVGEGAIIGAGSLVLAGKKIPPRQLWAGSPAKYIKDIPAEQFENLNMKTAEGYIMYKGWYE